MGRETRILKDDEIRGDLRCYPCGYPPTLSRNRQGLSQHKHQTTPEGWFVWHDAVSIKVYFHLPRARLMHMKASLAPVLLLWYPESKRVVLLIQYMHFDNPEIAVLAPKGMDESQRYVLSCIA
jgi:hypothetical protein